MTLKPIKKEVVQVSNNKILNACLCHTHSLATIRGQLFIVEKLTNQTGMDEVQSLNSPLTFIFDPVLTGLLRGLSIINSF